MQDSDQLPCLNNYSSESISLLASRHRLHCQSSEKSSERGNTNQSQMDEFKQQIEERFNLSIANKIYTFPKRIETVEDILSSSEEDEQEYSISKNKQTAKENKYQKIGNQLFKKKSFGKASDSKRKQNLSSSKHYFNADAQYLNNSGKEKGKIKDRKSNSKTKRIKSKSKEKSSIKIDKTITHKQRSKGDRLKTEPEPNIIGTIRAKLVKRN